MEGMRSLGFGQLTGLSSAKLLSAITGGIPAGSSFAMITAEGQAVRWRDDGTSPTTSVGYPLPVGGELHYDSASFGSLSFIETAASATLSVTFYGK
jgi:hypothetical protein